MGASFRKLKVWQKAKDLTVNIYKLTESGKLARDYSLRDQMRRSAVSIASNIAEGDERGTNKDSVRFLYMARGSAAELLTQMLIAHEVDYLNNKELKEIEEKIEVIAGMLYRLIEARGKTINR